MTWQNVTFQACFSFKVGDRVVFSDQYGVEERGLVLAVYPDDGRCVFQADSAHNVVRKVAASDLTLNEADWVSVGG